MQKKEVLEKLQSVGALLSQEAEDCEGAMALTAKEQELTDRLRYIRDDSKKHIGFVKMLTDMVNHTS